MKYRLGIDWTAFLIAFVVVSFLLTAFIYRAMMPEGRPLDVVLATDRGDR